MPPDELLRRLYAALVYRDEDRDTFNDTFLYLYSHPCPAGEYGHKFVTRFYFLRKERWMRQSKEFPVDTLPDIPLSDPALDAADSFSLDAADDLPRVPSEAGVPCAAALGSVSASVPCAALQGSVRKANNTVPVNNETQFLNSLKHAILEEIRKKRQPRHTRKRRS